MSMATTTLESGILKRNTDCVYFLASPLTCKKGSECEYRHSDIARLNPRDCWYWLSGNCLNPTCAFRHPPLEGLTEASSSSVHVAHHSVITTNKTNVPCYFYFNTYCTKGDQCPFSHVMDDVSHARKFPKVAPEATSSHLPMNKASTGSDTGPAVEVPANFTEGVSNPKELMSETLVKNVDNAAANNISDEPSSSHDSPASSNPDYEEPIVKSPDNPSPEDKYMNGREDLFSEHSSEQLVKDCTEREEWWESSPGFDVLVDDVSEQLPYEDDADYLQVRERESERLHSHLMHYDYEDSVSYDPMDYPDRGFLYDHHLYDSYEHFSDGYTPDYAGTVSEPSGERMLDSMLHQKRRSSQGEWDTEQCWVDLRDHLRKRRRMDVHLVSHNSRKCHPSHAKSTSQQCPEGSGMHLPYYSRLSSELGRELGGKRVRLSHSAMESALAESCRRGGRLGHPYYGRPTVHSRNSELLGSLDDCKRRKGRLGYRDFGRPLVHTRRRENRGRRGRQVRQPSVPRALAMKETRPRQLPLTTFTGPQTLIQMKQERRKAHTGRYGSTNVVPRQHRRVVSSEFEGPKRLSELLKDRKKFKSVSDVGNESATDYEATGQPERSAMNGYLDEGTGMHHHDSAGGLGGEYGSECLRSAEDDDEDDLARKVARMLA